MVVTKKLCNSLLQIVHKPSIARRGAPNWDATDRDMFNEAMRVFGVNGAALQPDQSYYGVERSLLVYMTASVLHPNQEWRLKFKQYLKTRNVDVDKIGENLVTFIRYFVSSLSMTSYQRKGSSGNGLTGNIFDCLEQGKNLAGVFDKFGNGDKADQTFAATGMLLSITLYYFLLLSTCQRDRTGVQLVPGKVPLVVPILIVAFQNKNTDIMVLQ